ncbi:MAG TPA: nitrous oxide reductase family maturation protein NosD [Vicinamibacterales bacterium]|nr:nitrous oxide reductase family maturation protein NosD [Vicinamibacterales bacterium]
MTGPAGLLIVAMGLAGQAGADHASAPARLEGRPATPHASPLQREIDAAPPGATIEVPPGTYDGDLFIDKPLRLIGRQRPVLRGSGTGSVVLVRADGVTIEGFDVDGRGGGDLGRDSSGIHLAARNAVVRDCRIENALFGVYLLEAHGSTIERCRIRGIPGKDPGEKGSGIHAYNTEGMRLIENEVLDARDAIYLQNSSKGIIRGNRARDMRYGLHYMFSDDNLFEDNVFENGAAGSAIMYSERIVFRRNQFIHNRGFASVGLLLQQCDDVLAESNLIADNARGVFLEGTQRVVFRGNVIAQSDAAIVAFDSAVATRFEGNSFVGNMTPLLLVGKRLDAVFSANYWSGHAEPDLDGDGRTERPYRLTSVFDHMRGNLTAADLYVDGFAGAALSLAEIAFPVLEPVRVVEEAPLARPPALPAVPRARRRETGTSYAGLGFSALGLMLGIRVLRAGR